MIDATESPAAAELPTIDPAGDIEVNHVAVPYMPQNGAQGLSVGGHFNSGFKVSGVVRRLILQKNGVVRATLEMQSGNPHEHSGKYAFLYFRDWTYLEPRHEAYQDIDERTALGT